MPPRWVYVVRLRFRSIFRRAQVERELDEELRFHLEARSLNEIAAGRTPQEGRRTALRAMGGLEQRKEECRDMRHTNITDNLRRDVRYAVRTLARSPRFTVAALLALALGIGTTTAVFSVVHGVLLRPLPYAEAERLVWIQDGLTQSTRSSRWGACVADFLLWQSRSHSFESLAAWTGSAFNLTGDGEAEHVTGLIVTARFFDVLRVRPLHGRTFAPDEDQPGRTPVTLISERLWQRRYRSDPAVIGRSVELNGRQFTVIGVIPPGFRFQNREADVWAILTLNPPTRRGPFFLRGVARLRPGVTLEQASREMDALGAEVERADPKRVERVRYPVTTLMEEITGDIRPLLAVLSGAVGLVLLIAVFNVANLMLARATVRQREMAIRLSLGAGGVQLARQLLTECIVLSLAAGLSGAALATAGVSMLRALAPPGLPRIDEIAVDGRVLLFTLLVSMASGVAFGLVPAAGVARSKAAERLKEGGRTSDTRRGGRLRAALVVSEIALSIVLLAGAGLFIRSFVLLGRVHTGFEAPPDRLLALQLAPTGAGYLEQPPLLAYWERVLSRVRVLVGVESAALAITLPPDRVAFSDGFEVPGRTPKEGGPVVPVPWVSYDYFRTLGIPVLRGRVFDRRDKPGSPGVKVISEALARRYFPGEDPIGKRLKHGGPSLDNPYGEIIGVVADVKYEGLAGENVPVYYESADQYSSRPMWLVVRTVGPARQWLNAVRAEIRAIDPNVPVAVAASMEEALNESVALPQFRTTLMAIFAFSALALAAVGIYGVLSYSVERRTQEIGVRMAIGATPPDVLRLVIGQGGRLASVGMVLGLAGAFALTRLLQKMLFGVSASDTLTFAGSAVVLGAVAVVASLIPAWRAARIDPVTALRRE
jgi:putative ABC transport system permease protein